MNEESDGVFCRTCRTNQTLILAITANWEAEKDEEEEISSELSDEKEAEDQRLETFSRWRNQLEQRYPPVCSNCLPKVQIKLKNADKQARALIWNDLLRESQRRNSGSGVQVQQSGKARAAHVSLKSRKDPLATLARQKGRAAAPDLSSLSLDADQSLASTSFVFEHDDHDPIDVNHPEDSMDWTPTPCVEEEQRAAQRTLLGPQRFFEPLRNTGLEDLLSEKLGLSVPAPVDQTPDGDTVMVSAASQDRQEALSRQKRNGLWWLFALFVVMLAYLLCDRRELTESVRLTSSNVHAGLRQWWEEGRSKRAMLYQDGIWARLQQ